MEQESKDQGQEGQEIHIEVTEQELRDAVSCYDLLEAEEIKDICRAVSQVDDIGVRAVQAMQEAAKAAVSAGQKDISTILVSAAIVPALVIGLLVGQSKLRAESEGK